ncbi:MAG: hypothetical protein K5756_07285 [Clostridiales bacterium]|nr:hypothetical protein [Clostridiales bacterium]
MAKRRTIKFFAVILTLVLAAVPLLSCIASAEQSYPTPIICVPGVYTANIYAGLGTENERLAFPPTQEAIDECVNGLPQTVFKLAQNADWKGLSDAVSPIICKLFEDFACDADGSPKEGTGIKWSYPSIKKKDGVRSSYTFYYDWRLDLMEIAEDLNDFVNYVCEGMGCDKVIFDVHSMGGSLLSAYISLYGYDKIEKVVLNSTAIFGTSVAGDPFSKKIKFSPVAIARYVDEVISGTDDQSEFIKATVELLAKAGILDYVGSFGDVLIENLMDYVYEDALMETFGTMPSLWALIPASQYDDALDIMVTDETSPVLVERIMNFKTHVTDHAEEIVRGFDQNNIPFIVVVRYNYQLPPVIEKWENNSDGVIDAKYTSFGATCAPLGEKLSDEYLAAANAKYISPDKSVDASTCMFPERTWFVKDLQHSSEKGNRFFNQFYAKFYNSDEQITVDTFEEYPQFLKLNADGEVVPEEMENIPNPTSWLQTIIRFFKAAYAILMKWLAKYAGVN